MSNLTPDEQRIRDALEQIETPMYDILSAIHAQRARRRAPLHLHRPHRLLTAVFVAALLTATAAAAVVQLSGGWQVLFGQNVVLPEALAVPLQQAQTIDGCTLTLEDAIVSQNDVGIIYSLQQKDGTPFPEPVDLEEVSLLIDGADRSTSSQGQTLFTDENAAKQYVYYEFELDSDPGGHTLTLSAGPAFRTELSDTLTTAIDLSAIFRTHPLRLRADEDASALYAQQDAAGAHLPQFGALPAVSMGGVAVDDTGLRLALCTPCESAAHTLSADIVSVLDTRTGKSIPNDGSSYCEANGQTVGIRESRFLGLREEDLPFLLPQIIYTYREPVTSRAWTIDFTAASLPACNRQIDLSLPDGLQVDRLLLSPLGLELEGSQPPADDIPPAPEVQVILRDGTTLHTSSEFTGTSGSDNSNRECFTIQYYYQSDRQGRQFLSTPDVTAVRIGSTTITIAE